MSRLINLDRLIAEKFDGHLSPGTLRNWCSEGRFPFVRIGNRVLFDEDEVDRWIEERRRESAALRSERRARLVPHRWRGADE